MVWLKCNVLKLGSTRPVEPVTCDVTRSLQAGFVRIYKPDRTARFQPTRVELVHWNQKILTFFYNSDADIDEKEDGTEVDT